MKRQVIIDTGPLVAFLSQRDSYLDSDFLVYRMREREVIPVIAP